MNQRFCWWWTKRVPTKMSSGMVMPNVMGLDARWLISKATKSSKVGILLELRSLRLAKCKAMP